MTEFINMASEAINNEELVQIEFIGRREEYSLVTGILVSLDIENGIITLNGERFYYSFPFNDCKCEDDSCIFELEGGILVFRKTD